MSESQELMQPSTTDDEIDLKELFMVLWHRKSIILGVTLLAAVISVGVALYLPNIYSTSALLAPKSSESSGLSQMARQYGGIASMAGISLGGSDAGSGAAIAVETLKSRQFFRDYVYETALVELMAVKSWHRDSNRLVFDPEIYDKGQWVREVDYPTTPKPSVQEAFQVFSALLSVSEDKLSGFVTVSIEHVSPEVAKRWVDLMIKGINEAIRGTAIAEAQSSIEYLTTQLKQTPLVSLDKVFAQLIEEQTKTLMLAHASEDYVFQVIDPPVVSERKSKPQRALIAVLGTLLGGMLVVLSVLIFHYSASRPRENDGG